MLDSPHLRGLDRAFPICTPGASDTARFDEALELLHLGGRPLPPRRADDDPRSVGEQRRDAGRAAGVLPLPLVADGAMGRAGEHHVHRRHDDRRGARPQRPAPEPLLGHRRRPRRDGVRGRRHRHRPVEGREEGPPAARAHVPHRHRRRDGSSTTARSRPPLAAEHPYEQWLDDGLVEFADLPAREHLVFSHDSVLRRQQLFGYTHEELKIIVAPMAKSAYEPLGSMGTDTPLAVLSERPRLLFDYFSQLFAQVTNPPLDAIREEVVTSVASTVGPEANLLAPGPESCRQLALPFPIIDNDELAKIIHANADGSYPGLQAKVIKGLYRVAGGGLALERALSAICSEVSSAIESGARVIVLSDRNTDQVEAPIPSLLLTAAVHHHLVRTKQRTMVGLIVECGDAREVHHMALLIGYGAGAINPYLAFESIEDLIAANDGRGMHGLGEVEPAKAVKNYIKACGKGVLKVMSKMGVSTVASYTGAQIFEAIGLGTELVDRYFTRHGQPSRRHRPRRDRGRGRGPPRGGAPDAARGAGAPQARARRRVPVAPRGRAPPLQPDDRVQAAARHACEALRHLQGVHRARRRPVEDRWRRCAACSSSRPASASRWPIEEVESIAAIMRRFSTGAMSYGSISAEAHETLAIAMNRLGAQVEHRRGRRGCRPPARPGSPVGDQAGGLRAVRRDRRVPHERRRPADQDGPGREARRGRPAPGPQGVPVDREDTALDAGRRPDQPAAAPRHLLDRGPQAADPRPEERQPGGPHPREARRRDGRRHRRGRCVEGEGRRRADLRPRRRHGRQPADVAQARRRTVGARPRRDPADAAAQRPARPHRRPGRRSDEDRSRRRHRRAARGRGVRLRHGAARGVGVRDDARLPPRHVPGRHRHPEPGAPRPVRAASPSSSRTSSSSSPPRSAS